MDEQKYLIVDNRQGFKDLTSDVKSIKFRGNLVDISFHNSEKTFAYSRKNVIFSDKPAVIENDVAINGHIELNASTKVISLPMENIESLNVSVAAAVIMYQIKFNK